MKLAAGLEPEAIVLVGEIHFCIAFGYVCGVLGFAEDLTVGTFLHQNVAALLSAAQRLLALGQTQSSGIAWELKPFLAEAVSAGSGLEC